jgi:hypothetical protein
VTEAIEVLTPTEVLGHIFWQNNQYHFRPLHQERTYKLLEPNPESAAWFPANTRSLMWAVWGLALRSEEGIRLKTWRVGTDIKVKLPIVFIKDSWWFFYEKEWAQAKFLNKDRKDYLVPQLRENLNAALRSGQHPMVEITGLVDLFSKKTIYVHKVHATETLSGTPAYPDTDNEPTIHSDLIT